LSACVSIRISRCTTVAQRDIRQLHRTKSSTAPPNAHSYSGATPIDAHTSDSQSVIRTVAKMLLDKKPPAIAAAGRGTPRTRGFIIDTMVALTAAIALTVLYLNVIAWAQQPTRALSLAFNLSALS